MPPTNALSDLMFRSVERTVDLATNQGSAALALSMGVPNVRPLRTVGEDPWDAFDGGMKGALEHWQENISLRKWDASGLNTKFQTLMTAGSVASGFMMFGPVGGMFGLGSDLAGEWAAGVNEPTVRTASGSLRSLRRGGIDSMMSHMGRIAYYQGLPMMGMALGGLPGGVAAAGMAHYGLKATVKAPFRAAAAVGRRFPLATLTAGAVVGGSYGAYQLGKASASMLRAGYDFKQRQRQIHTAGDTFALIDPAASTMRSRAVHQIGMAHQHLNSAIGNEAAAFSGIQRFR